MSKHNYTPLPRKRLEGFCQKLATWRPSPSQTIKTFSLVFAASLLLLQFAAFCRSTYLKRKKKHFWGEKIVAPGDITEDGAKPQSQSGVGESVKMGLKTLLAPPLVSFRRASVLIAPSPFFFTASKS